MKLEGSVLGRADFMVTVRGTNVYQSAVENLLAEVPAVSSFYELVLRRENDNDTMTVRCEPVRALEEKDWAELARTVSDHVHAALHVRLKVEVVPPDSLPRYEIKTKRIIDERPAEFRRALDRVGGRP
jgi:phenylacetate-CoA ligase